MSIEESKIRLNTDGSSRGATLLPTIMFCLEEGAKLQHHAATAENPYVADKSGVETCALISPITVEDILKRFLLPEDITAGKNSLWDSKNSVGLDLISPERYAEHSKERALSKEKIEETA